VAPEKHPPCEFEDCQERQQWCVSGQWSIVDFLAYYVCAGHVIEAMDHIDHLQFDGLPVQEVLVLEVRDS